MLHGWCAGRRGILWATIGLAELLATTEWAAAQRARFTLEQALSAPFTENLRPAPAKRRFAWVANIDGRRNIWVAVPATDGRGYTSHQVTHYSEDDGQEISSPEWTPDAASILYTRGGAAQGEGHPVPNPAWVPGGVVQQIWFVSIDSGEPRLIGEGNEPTVSPNGRWLAYRVKGQLWAVPLDQPSAKPEQVLQTRGVAENLRWSPDSKSLAFVSNRDDHSFVAVYSMEARAIIYLDPSTDLDQAPIWSPDSRRVAFLRLPSDKDALLFEPHLTGFPWSIRVADVSTGSGHEIWRAAEGTGSVFRETASPDQLHWMAGDRIVFPWEGQGWLHLYAVPSAGGSATPLTPGDFEVEHVTQSADRRALVFDSNQSDIDRRHVWKLTFPENGFATAAQAVTSGEGIETQPVIASDNTTVAVLRSDAHVPMRAAIVDSGKLIDLAPQAIPPDFAGSLFVVPQQVRLSAADGMAIHAQLFLPPDLQPGERRPAAVFFHGGSQRQMLLGWHYMEYYSNAYAMNQYLAAKGYIVLSVNYRSGIGYGLNFREALNYGATGASEFNDVLGAGMYLKGRPDVDGARIAAWGGSYGGYLTALALARASALFAAGVDMHGVHDWNLELPTFSPNYDARARADYARIAFESSPLASVSTWKSPVLLVHGDDDRNVPFAETVQQVEALRRQRVDYEELVFPDEIHDLLLRKSWLKAYSAAADFLDRKLTIAETSASPHASRRGQP
jgi:dipeptidyl aminopeptidase/acylaminoacyl peptidase